MPPGAEGSSVISSTNEEQASCRSSSPHRLDDIRGLLDVQTLELFHRCGQYFLPSQQSVRRHLCQHCGRRHATVAQLQLLDNISPRSEGDAHPRSNDADVILPARRLFEGGDELSLKRTNIGVRERTAMEAAEWARPPLPAYWTGSLWTAALPVDAPSLPVTCENLSSIWTTRLPSDSHTHTHRHTDTHAGLKGFCCVYSSSEMNHISDSVAASKSCGWKSCCLFFF